MDISQLRKVQETAKRLRNHNIEFSTNEAIQQVSSNLQVGGADVPQLNISTIKDHVPIHRIEKQEGQMADDVTAAIKKKIEEQSNLISQQAKLIYDLQSKINEIIKEINKMQTSVPTRSAAERQQVLKTEERKEHPRSGGYKPEDVAIDKMFYAGNK